ncbi:MAG: hypothetical protein JWL75_92 [Parcubacteria group bacterium]|nr:hypothetical protein [Parcubacteria group bacterium]
MNDNAAVNADPRTLRFLPLDEETERQLQAALVFLPANAPWSSIRRMMYLLGCGPFFDPKSWEKNIKSYFGEDIFDKPSVAA